MAEYDMAMDQEQRQQGAKIERIFEIPADTAESIHNILPETNLRQSK